MFVWVHSVLDSLIQHKIIRGLVTTSVTCLKDRSLGPWTPTQYAILYAICWILLFWHGRLITYCTASIGFNVTFLIILFDWLVDWLQCMLWNYLVCMFGCLQVKDVHDINQESLSLFAMLEPKIGKLLISTPWVLILTVQIAGSKCFYVLLLIIEYLVSHNCLTMWLPQVQSYILTAWTRTYSLIFLKMKPGW